jgi:hypothetical protein
MDQYQRHFMVRVPGKPTRAAVTPFVKSWYVRPEVVAAYKDRISDKFLSAAEVDHALFELRNRLSIEATGHSLQIGGQEMVEFSEAPPPTFRE